MPFFQNGEVKHLEEEILIPEEDGDDALSRKHAAFDGAHAFRLVNAMKRRMKDLLALPAPPCDTREYLEALGVPSHSIDICMLLTGELLRMALDQNLRAIQEIRSIIENDESDMERKTRRANLEKIRAQVEDIRRKLSATDRIGDEDEDGLAEVLEESAASLWTMAKEGENS